MIDLLVCDDSDEARAALRTMLADHDEIAIVGEAVNGEDAVAQAIALTPDVVLMDLTMPVVDGLEATRRISQLLPDARVVAFSGSDDSESVGAMMAAGAAAYCVKGAPLWELERAIAGRSDPLVRLAHGLARATNRAGIGTIVCRELLELTGGSAAAAYVASPDVALSLAGFAGEATTSQARRRAGHGAEGFLDAELDLRGRRGSRRARAARRPMRRRARRAADLRRRGAGFAPSRDAGQFTADEDFVADIAGLAASAFAAERRLALTHAEARRDALTGLANRRAFEERLDEAFREAVATEAEVEHRRSSTSTTSSSSTTRADTQPAMPC